MQNFVEHTPCAGGLVPTGADYHRERPINRTERGDGPLRVSVYGALDYEGMTDYIRSWPEKLVSFVVERLCDDDWRPFARQLYEHLRCGDGDGPPFTPWEGSVRPADDGR